MMALPFMSAHSLALFKNIKYNNRLLYTCIRNYAKKKEYDYDLDALINWKNETDLVFGKPRKLTTKGKLRKSKNNENGKLCATMEILSAQADHFSRHDSFGKDNEPSIDFDDRQNSTISSIQGLSGFDDQPSNGIVQGDGSAPSGLVGRFHDLPDLSSEEVFETEGYIIKSSKKKIYKKRSNTAEDTNNDDIQIPVISPIPAGNYSAPKSYNEVEASTVKPVKQNLPVEPPDSFSFINNVPLSFSSNEVQHDISKKILQFTEDVKSLSLRKVPSVKSILNKTMPDLNRFFLNRWREKMIAELGAEGFKVHQEATIKRGVNFHANVMELLSGKPESEIQIMPDNEGHWASLQTAMKHISGVRALEEDMQHPALLYRGVADCVAKYKDLLCVIDWKTSKNPRPLLKNTYDDPLQVAAYIGLICANKEPLKIREVNHGLLVISYPDGSPAHIHLMNKSMCEQYWQDWLGRLYNYYQLVYTEKHGAG